MNVKLIYPSAFLHIRMKIIGILTQDFRVYYDLITELRKRELPFSSLTFEDPIPMHIGVIITTKGEENKIDFPSLVFAEDGIEHTIDIAQRTLKGKDKFKKLMIGIDPGERPGLAVIGDGEVLLTQQVASPEEVKYVVERALTSYPADESIIRIGHGDTTHRNRIINSLRNFNIKIEISDESRTTKICETPDIDAAIDIALKSGFEARGTYEIEPTEGELKDIQRRSRIESKGRVTISKEEARRVAVGELTLKEAIKRAQNEPENE
jgi:hypothetical protein